MKRAFFERIDIKVMIIILVLTIAVSISQIIIVYTLSYNAMIEDILGRSRNIYDNVVLSFDIETYAEINSPEDELKDSYILAQKNINRIMKTGNLNDLYTIKLNDSGEFVYVIDGTPKYLTDFNHVGDLVDSGHNYDLKECFNGVIISKMERNLSNSTRHFITFTPIFGATHKIVGIVGMDFDVTGQLGAYDNILKYAVIFGALIALIALIVTNFALKRVSDPFFKKLAYTDYMTNLRNRTAFEIDIRKINDTLNDDAKLCIIAFDLDNLKTINDTMGHAFGDAYIKKAAAMFQKKFKGIANVYRTGGDEFTAIAEGFDKEVIQECLDIISNEDNNSVAVRNMNVKFSYGQAWYEFESDKTVYDVYNRADSCMYQMKNEARKKARLL